MTLRVELSIIPYGDEKNKRVIETVNISNVGSMGFGLCKYIIEHNDYKNAGPDTPTILHNRQDGAIYLVAQALNKLLENNETTNI